MPVRTIFFASPYDAAQTPAHVFRILSIAETEERDSDNYESGSYYLGRAGSLEVKIWRDEYYGFEEFPYRLALDMGNDSGFTIDEALDLAIVELLQAGFAVAREVGNKPGEVKRELYALRGSNLIKTQDTKPVPKD